MAIVEHEAGEGSGSRRFERSSVSTAAWVDNVGGVPHVAVAQVVARASQGDSGIGPVAIVVGLTVASVLLLSWLIGRLPGSDENTGAGVFSRRRRDPFAGPPDDTTDRPQRGPFDN